MVVTEASQKGIWTHGHLYGNRSRYVFSTYYRLGFRLLGLSCVLVQTHHLHRPKAHLRSLCCFKAFAKAEKSEFQFSKSRSWSVGHRSLLDERQTPPHCGLFFVDWSQDHFVAFHQLIILTGQGNIRELLVSTKVSKGRAAFHELWHFVSYDRQKDYANIFQKSKNLPKI